LPEHAQAFAVQSTGAGMGFLAVLRLTYEEKRTPPTPLEVSQLSFPKAWRGDGEFHGLRCSRKDKLYCTRHLKGSEGKKYSSWSFWAAEVTCLAMPAARY